MRSSLFLYPKVMLYGVPLGILLSLVHQSAAEAWVSQAVREKDKPASKYPFSCKVVTGFLPVSLLEENILRRLLFSLSGCIFLSLGHALPSAPGALQRCRSYPIYNIWQAYRLQADLLISMNLG